MSRNSSEYKVSILSRPLHDVVVVIPVYKPSLTPQEQIAFDQCLAVLGRHPITIVAPEGLGLEQFSHTRIPVTIERFDQEYFAGVSGYNRLMMSQEFYSRFIEYRYILIHQLDVFVFADALAEWCATGYDYIGAPWVGFDYAEDCRESLPFWVRNRWLRRVLTPGRFMVGNGGLSLRKVRTFLGMLKLMGTKVKTWPYHEDVFWSILVPAYNPLFRIPDADLARRFAIELYPRQSVERNGGELPFGCHAWEKYDPEFWWGVIRRYGYSL